MLGPKRGSSCIFKAQLTLTWFFFVATVSRKKSTRFMMNHDLYWVWSTDETHFWLWFTANIIKSKYFLCPWCSGVLTSSSFMEILSAAVHISFMYISVSSSEWITQNVKLFFNCIYAILSGASSTCNIGLCQSFHLWHWGTLLLPGVNVHFRHLYSPKACTFRSTVISLLPMFIQHLVTLHLNYSSYMSIIK